MAGFRPLNQERYGKDSAFESISINQQFQDWLLANVTLDDAIRRLPDLLTDLLEEYNNDWCEAVSNAAVLNAFADRCPVCRKNPIDPNRDGTCVDCSH